MADALAEPSPNVEVPSKLPAPPAAQITQPTQAAPALISSSPANQSTAAASGGGAGAVMVILIWLLSEVHIAVPSEVAVAMTSLVGTGVHWAVLKYGLVLSSDN
jgi:hypothetical protein